MYIILLRDPENFILCVKLGVKILILFVTTLVQASLSRIATVSGSILSMWALEPSIYQLLASHSGILCPKMLRMSPSLHYTTLYLFLQHCATHSFFLSSSSLIMPGSTSPASGNFAHLLKLVSTLQSWTEIPLHTRQYVVKMIGNILNSIKSSSSVLSVTPDFQHLLDSCIGVCYESLDLCPNVLDNMSIILDEFPLSVSSLISVTFLLLHVSRTGQKSGAAVARKVLGKIPPQITFSRERAKQLDCVRQVWIKILNDIYQIRIQPFPQVIATQNFTPSKISTILFGFDKILTPSPSLFKNIFLLTLPFLLKLLIFC